MKLNFPYGTLHDFLDRELAFYEGNPPVDALMAKRKEYRKMYAKWYRRVYRERMRQITVQFSTKEFKEIRQKAKDFGMRVSSYIKSQMKGEARLDSTRIRIQLLTLFDIIEECIHEEQYTRLPECLLLIETILKELS